MNNFWIDQISSETIYGGTVVTHKSIRDGRTYNRLLAVLVEEPAIEGMAKAADEANWQTVATQDRAALGHVGYELPRKKGCCDSPQICGVTIVPNLAAALAELDRENPDEESGDDLAERIAEYLEKNGIEQQEINEGVRLTGAITLRQLEAAGVTLNSDMGCDADEHAELLDDEKILRFSVDVVAGINEDNEVFSNDLWDAECFDMRLGDDEATWKTCVGPHLDGTAATERAWMKSCEAVGTAVRTRYPELDGIIGEIQTPLEEWCESQREENEEE